MSTILMGMVLCCLSAGFAVLWRRRIEDLFGFSVLFSVILLYFFGMAGRLSWGVYAVTGLAAAAAVVSLVHLIMHFRETAERLFTPGLLAFLLLLLWMLVVYRNRLADNFGDFSHWALEIKNMWLLEQIPNAHPASTIYFTDYPPASALFAYYWMWLAGAFSEGDMFRSLVVFCVSMLLPLFRRITWKNWKGFVPACLIVFALPLVFNMNAYSTLEIDMLLGSVGAYAVYMAHQQKAQKGGLLMVGAALFVLPMIKVSGTGIALLVLGILVTDWLYNRRFEKWQGFCLAVAGLLICILASNLTWSLFLSSRLPDAPASAEPSRLLTFLQSGMEPYQKMAWDTFVRKMIEPAYWENFSEHTYLFWLIAFVVLGAALAWKEDGGVRRLPLLVACAVGAVLYAFSLLAAYWFSFTPEEAEILNECDRYFSTFQLILFAVLIYAAFEMWHEKNQLGGRRLAALAVCVLLILSPTRLYANSIAYQKFIRGAELSRASMRPSAAVMESLDPETDKVFYLSHGAEDYAYWVVRYELTPVPLSQLTPGVHLASEGVAGGVVESPQAWVEQLTEQGYTHVYLYHVDDTFKENSGMLFAQEDLVENATLFRVTGNAEKPLEFVAQ